MRALREAAKQGNTGALPTVTNNVQSYAQSLTARDSPGGEDSDEDLANLNDVINSQVQE